MSRSRFRTRTHALDAVETFPNRFGDFYFSSKNHDFRKFPKILENPWKSIDLCSDGSSSLIQGGRLLLVPEEREEPERWRDRCAGAPQASQSP